MKYLQKALPHIVALVVFAAVSAMFFAPQYRGEALRQGDMVQVGGMAQDIVEHQQQYGEHPGWAGRMFGGMPAYMVNMNYQGRWIKSIADLTYFLGQPAAFLFVAMAAFYLMLLLFGINAWLAMIGGLTWGLSTYFPIIIEAGHITKMMALAWIPPVVGGVYYAYRKNLWLGAAITGIFLSVEISTSHPQITYYFAFAVFALFVNELIRAFKAKTYKKFIVVSLVLAGAAMLAVGSNLVQLYYQADYAKDSNRGGSELKAVEGVTTSGLDKDYATAWSYGKAESFNMFIPNFEGGSSSGGFAADGEVARALGKYQAAHIAPQLPAYHGDQPFTSGPVYIGAVMVFLMVLGLFIVDGRKKWWIVAVSVLALLLAWGHNFMWFTSIFLDYFPLYNKFRTVSMILVILEWSVPLLAIFALQKLYNRDLAPEKFRKALTYSLVITGGFALFAALIVPNFMDFSAANDAAMGLPDDVVSAMQSERATLLTNDALRSLLFVVLTAAVVWLYYKEKIKTAVMVAAVALLTTVDLYQVDRRFVKTEDFRPRQQALAIQPTEANQQILQDKSDCRVADFTANPFASATASAFHRSVGGYHAAKLRRYQDVIDAHLSKQNMAVYDMLNTKYFITDKGVQVNDGAVGSAWFVENIRWVATPDEELAALGEDFVPNETAVVDKRFENELKGIDIARDSGALIHLEDYKVNVLTYKYSSQSDGVVVFSEIYYPKGWKVFVDGNEKPYFRADYILRAMVVPAGEHTIEWKFEVPHFEAMTNLTRASSVALMLLLGFGFFVTFNKRDE